jgi:alkylation response protein AidB-like acyl-CoA dehydrogenase
METGSSVEAVLADVAQSFAKRHRDALDAVEQQGPLPALVLNGCEALGWLGELEDEVGPDDGREAERPTQDHPGSRYLAVVVHELSRVSPALGTRLLCHHFARHWCRSFSATPDAPSHPGEPPSSPWFSMAPFDPGLLESKAAAPIGDEVTEDEETVPLVLANPIAATVVARIRTSGRVALVRLALEDATQVRAVETLGLTGLGVADVGGFRSSLSPECVLSDQPEVMHQSARRALRYVFPAYLALARAILRTAHEGARAHAELRHQGGGRLDALSTIQARLAILTESQATLAALEGHGGFSDDELVALLPRVRALMLKSTDASLQIFGGAGYVVGTGQERLWRDARQLACLFGSRLGKLA